jgi:hypothetical protein
VTIYLYVKTHNKTGLQYLGKTASKDPHKYPGSGADWRAHLKEHGADYTTEIIRECQTNEELSEWGRYYSNLWNVVKSTNWANRIPETGGGGNHTEERKEVFRQQQLGKKKPPRTDAHKTNLSNATKGIPKPRSKEHQAAWIESSKLNWANNTQRKQQISELGKSSLGRKHTPETLEKKRQAMLEYWAIKRSLVPQDDCKTAQNQDS